VSPATRGVHVHLSRANYAWMWRQFTSYNWRAANAESRRRHRADRRLYDRQRYWRKRIATLHDEALQRDAWLTERGYV
jgi:hypothetical protein